MIWTQDRRGGTGRKVFSDADLRAALASAPSQAAAARALGVSPAAVCKRLARARGFEPVGTIAARLVARQPREQT